MNVEKYLEKCEICPHKCKVNRLNGNIGRCKATDKIKIALVSLHQYEEPCISVKVVLELFFFQTVICLVNIAKTMK